MTARCLVLALVLLGVAACDGSPRPVDPGPSTVTPTPLEGCVPGTPTAEALKFSGPDEAGGTILPIGRRVAPVGRVIETVRWPLAAAFSPDGAYAYVAHNGQARLDVIDVAAGKVLQTLSFPTHQGVAVTADGATVFVGGAESGKVQRLARQADGTLVAGEPWHFDAYVATLALSPGGRWLYVVSNSNSRVWQVDPATGEVSGELLAGEYPYGVAVAPDQTTVYVSNAGGDDVTVLDFAAGEVRAVIPTDLNPMGLALDATGATLFVANSDADTLSVIDTTSLAVVDAIDVRVAPDDPLGGSPNELALSPDGLHLFVSQADLNEVDVVDITSRAVQGRIPGGFYTTGLAVSADGGRLLICNSKGVGSVGDSPNNVTGSVSLVDLPLLAGGAGGDGTLAAWTAQVAANNTRVKGFYPTDCPYPVPKALADGTDKPIEHVVVVLKENKTYDAVFGDLEAGHGDPALAVFGEKYTPNAHALARRYTLLDNYYCDSEHSSQGHNWATQADANDLFEKTDNVQMLLIGYDPSIVAHERTIFDHLYDHQVSFRVYGQWVGFAKDWFGKFEPYANQKVPFFNLSISDVHKAREVLREVSLGIFPEFVFLALPNDHTKGTKKGVPLPEVMVADNDQALGLLIEGLSKTPEWKKTVVFVIQDDAQGYGGDHIHPQRSPCLVIGPMVKKGYISSVHYSMPSVFRTVEMLFGLPPMNLNTAAAAPMYDVFLDADQAPDDAPYVGLVPDVPYAVGTGQEFGAAESEEINFDAIDDAEGLGYILWHHMKGPDVQPPPYAKWNDE